MENQEPIDNNAAILEFNRRMAKSNLIIFTKATMPSFDATWFHKKFYNALNDFAHGRIKKLMVFCPPQHGKSEGSTRRLPAYLLGLNPDLKVAIACYNATKAEKFNREIQRILDEPSYKLIFPDTTLSNGNDGYARNNTELEIVGHKGGIRSVGVGGGLTGETVDILIMDDLYKDAMEAWSPVGRENVENWYSTVAETRLHNDSRQLIVFTRWHDQDLAGRLLADPDHDWTVISYPAIKEGKPTDSDPRQEGEALYPAKHNIERLRASQTKDPLIFESLYQQNPQPKEGLLYQPFRTYSIFPTGPVIRKAYVDTADQGKDYLCSIVYAETPTGLYVIDVVYTQAGMEVTEILTAKQFSDHNVQFAAIESNNGGRGFARAVEAKLRAASNFKTRVEWFTQTMNKIARINTNSATVNNMIFFPEGWNTRWPVFYSHVTSYSALGKNAHDDAPDTLTGMVEKYGKRKKFDLRVLSGV